MSKKPLEAVIVGAGHRSLAYAAYAKECPEELRIVGVADPDGFRREQVREEYGVPEEHCFEDVAELTTNHRVGDVVINGTMDEIHVPTTLPLLEAGYDVLLEKPFATHETELWELVKAARQHQRKVMICHVLRYAPFYAAIRRKVAEGVIGRITNIQTTECVSYHHMGVGFVRGKWNSKERCGSSMLLAKCCHDLDLITWMKSGVAPVSVASFGGLSYFRPEQAPEGAGTRCLVDCPIEADCLYSAKKHYLDHTWWGMYVWQGVERLGELTQEQKVASLKTDNPHGRCVWKCDNDVVDHQSVAIEFEDGSTATHNLVGGTAAGSRFIHLAGTTGQIEGKVEDSRFTVRRIDPQPDHEYAEEVVDLSITGDMHGAYGGHAGGDLRLVADFVRVVRGEEPSISTTNLEDSKYSHLIAFAADQAMAERRVVDLQRE